MKRKTVFLILLLVFTTFSVQFFSIPIYGAGPCPSLPNTVMVDLTHPNQPDSYFLSVLTGGTSIDGKYLGWCIDIDNLAVLTIHESYVYCSYDPSLPTDIVDYPENLDLLNYMMNTDYSGMSITYSDIQVAIWLLVEGEIPSKGVPSYTQGNVDTILTDIYTNGEGYVPEFGDYVVIILQPVHGGQISIIKVPVTSDDDKTHPVVTIISPESKAYKTDASSISIPLIYTVNEPTSSETYSLDGYPEVPATSGMTLSGLSLGSHTITVYAKDMAGNQGEDTVSFTVKKPDPTNQKPKPVTLYDPTDITNTSMRLTWTKNKDSDFEKYVIYHSTSEDSRGQKVIDIKDNLNTFYQVTGLSEDTTYYYVVSVYDKGSLFSDSNQVSAKTKEIKPPILTILSPVEKTYNTSSVELTWLTNEPLKWAGFNLNGGTNTTITGDQTISDLEDGLYNLKLFGTDLAGNNGSVSVSFTIYTVVPDTEPPEITHIPVTDCIEGDMITISAIITDGSGVSEAELFYRKGDGIDYVLLEMSSTDADTYNAKIPASFVDDETIEYYILASDGVNEATHPSMAPTTNSHVIDVNLYPDPVALYEPASGDISTNTVELTWSESDEVDFRNYVVYMSDTKGELGDEIKEINERSETSHTVEELELDTTFYFSVRAYDNGGLYADSNQLEVHTGIRKVVWSTNLFVFLLLLLPLGGAIYYLRKRGKGPAGIIAPVDE